MITIGWIKGSTEPLPCSPLCCEMVNKARIECVQISPMCDRYLRQCQGLVKIDYQVTPLGQFSISTVSPLLDLFSYQQFRECLHNLDEQTIEMIIEFVELNELITLHELQCFRDFWALNSAVLSIFITAPASYKHHHCYPHGLLKHSVETARLSWNQAKELKLSSIECQLALISGLLHDVGKVFPILKSGGGYCPSEHECQNWTVLGVPLGQLAETKYPWYEILCDALTPRANKNIVNRIEKIVRFSDQLSAINDITEQRFSESPSHHHFKRHNKKKYRRAV